MSELDGLVRYLQPHELAELDQLLAGVNVPVWQPIPGPQTEALQTEADITFYGGAAGGGKTDLLLGCSLTQHRRSIIFRREFAQLKGIRERAEEIYGSIGRFNGQQELWKIQRGQYAGTTIEFGACQFPGDEKKYQGRAHDLKGFDEITHFTEAQFRFLITWNRTSLADQRCQVIAAGNPPTDAEGDWVIRYWGPWLDETHRNPAKPGELRWFVTDPKTGKDLEVDGPEELHLENEEGELELVRPKSRTFILAKVEDNPFLMQTGYKATLQSLPEPLRSRMLKGMFNIGREDADWQVIPSAWVIAAQKRWAPTFEQFLAKQAKERQRAVEIGRATQLEGENLEEGAVTESPTFGPDPIKDLHEASEDLKRRKDESEADFMSRLTAAMPQTASAEPLSPEDLKAILSSDDPVAKEVASFRILGERTSVVGVDVARGGRDRTVITERKGVWFSEQTCLPGNQTPDGNAVVQQLIKLGHSGKRHQIDVSGVGSSPVDVGRTYNLDIVAMNGAEISIAKDRSGKLGFANARAEWWWKLREDLDPVLGTGLALPPDPELLADLTAPRWSLNRRGILIEEKNAIKKRIGRSTDKGDSLVNAHAIPYQAAQGFMDFYAGQVRAANEQALAAAKAKVGLDKQTIDGVADV
jgi:hypothetical protein